MSMAFDPAEDDPLSAWLSGDGLATLDGITAESLDVIGVLDRTLTVRYLNWTTAGLTREAVVGGSVLDLMPPGYREVARETYTQALETGRSARFETMYKDGEHVLIWEVRVGPIRRAAKIIGLIVISSDVTEQRRAQAERARFFSLSLDLLIVASPEGILKRVNPTFGAALGYTTEELTGAPFVGFIHPDDRAPTMEAFARVLDGTFTGDFENRYRRRDGQFRAFSWRATVDPVTGDVYAVARDMTDHRVTEEQLRHRQKMEAVGLLAGGIAHDFNNLLLVISANTELAQLLAGPTTLAEHLDEVSAAARRATDLTKQLLAFSRRQPLRPVPVDLNELLRGLMKMLRRLLPESIDIVLTSAPDLATVNADPSQLEQVVVNLCVNARDSMEQGGRLTLDTANVMVDARSCEAHPWAKPGRYVLLSVTDSGIGMAAEVRERAFEPFFTTKGPQQGTGLGLSTVYGIVQQHGGMVHLYSEPGAGTAFNVYLPADARLAQEVGSKLESPSPRGVETILLAEDEEQVRRVVVQVLERAGYRTIAVTNGVEALKALRERTEPVHLVLLDVVMPDLGGPETWRLMQSFSAVERVIFISGYADERYRAPLPPDADILEEPFRAEDLLRLVRKKLDG